MAFCKNCGKELLENVRFCENCGAEVITEENTVKGTDTQDYNYNPTLYNDIIPQNQAMLKQKKHHIKKWIILLSTVLSALIITFTIVGVSSIVSQNRYKEKLEAEYNRIANSAETAESYATLESKVWYNCIHENSSSETDEYTKDGFGYFYSDFNDALSEFYNGEYLKYSTVKNDLTIIDKNMAELKNCPNKFKSEYGALKELYIAYSELTDLVVGNSSYSYNTYSEALENAKSNYKTALSSAKLLLG